MDNKNLGSKIAQAFGITISLCLMALIIALTAKIIIWIF